MWSLIFHNIYQTFVTRGETRIGPGLYFQDKLKSELLAELRNAEDLVRLELPSVIWQASIRRNMHLIYFSDRLILSSQNK